LARKSHLYQYHKENGKLTEFSGFDMPLWYRGIVEEHMAVRNSAGLFDVSHMGRVWITGIDATNFLSHLLPTNPAKIKDGRAFYSTICNESGGIVDDVITNRFASDRYLMIINAGNRAKDLSWLKSQSSSFDVSIDEISNNSALVALQGPFASQILQELTSIDLSTVRRFAFTEGKVAQENCLISRTGYTGEDGFEITIFDSPVDNPDRALKIWNEILSVGKDRGLLPCGLGARDSLRLEAGMCLYGQDIDEKTTPVEAALEFVLDDSHDYVGKATIAGQQKAGTERKRVCFLMVDSAIPRHGFQVTFSSTDVGTVTSGSFSPVLKKGIGMAYVKSPLSEVGQAMTIDVRGSVKAARVTSAPFYDVSQYGFKRKKESVPTA
jgi:aminomethyltransferase